MRLTINSTPPDLPFRVRRRQIPAASLLPGPALEPTLSCAAAPNEYDSRNEHY